MAFLIGQCCDDDFSGGDEGTPGITAPINDDIDFTNAATLRLQWNAARIAKYGKRGAFQVWMVNEAGDGVITNVQAIPNDLANPTYYDFDFGGLATGWIEIF